MTPTVGRDRVAAEWPARGFACDLRVDPPGRHLIPAGAVHSAHDIGKTTSRWLYGCRVK